MSICHIRSVPVVYFLMSWFLFNFLLHFYIHENVVFLGTRKLMLPRSKQSLDSQATALAQQSFPRHTCVLVYSRILQGHTIRINKEKKGAFPEMMEETWILATVGSDRDRARRCRDHRRHHNPIAIKEHYTKWVVAGGIKNKSKQRKARR